VLAGSFQKGRIMPCAWTTQKTSDVKKHGPERASWYTEWIEPDGRRSKSFGPGTRGRPLADRERYRLEEELLTGRYQQQTRKLWVDFRREYEDKVAAGLATATRISVAAALDHFERIIKPKRVLALSTQHIANFVAALRQEPGKKMGATMAPASINKHLRHLKAVLNVAREWGYLPQPPRFRMEKEPQKLPTYVTGEHFAAIYAACRAARRPAGLPYPAADWWRGLVVMGYMTGWRIGDILGLLRDDLDLEAGTAITRWSSNKGKRDERVKLHPAVVEHLRRLPGFSVAVFPWELDRRSLYADFLDIQQAAGIRLPCPEAHQHTAYCHVYGFHDLRRAFATMNADRVIGDALQKLMRHQSYTTTQLYINMARQLDQAVAALHVPDVLRPKAYGELLESRPISAKSQLP
jgi:integrase